MELELELLTNEKDEIQVIQKVMDLAKKAKELGFSIKELELETEDEEEEEEEEETEKEE
jgi:predicted RNA-binding protein with RPS1 domain